jgi:hypothetical protein
MNPSGLRIEEKKSEDRSVLTETRSTTSYKSTHSSRSSVLERAREYNRRIDEQNRHGRAKSLERSGSEASSAVWSQSTAATPRSQSAGRAGASTGGNRVSTRERAMASVRKEGPGFSNSSHKNQARGVSQTTDQTHPLTPASSSHNNTRPLPTTPRSSSQQSQPVVAAGQSQQQQTEASSQVNRRRSNESSKQQVKPSPSRSRNSKNGGGADGEAPPDAVVTPELLVDALSGHEDGLLAIAEKLMEHYDAGYDVMGEAIIDAFADVQKLFQHVVEAAHMEGAAFEASRRESEMTELRRQAAAGELRAADPVPESSPATPSGPNRHDEFIDQDVKDALTEAIRKGSSLRESNKHMECYVMFEAACQQSSSLLPVDSDHRGRLQLSIARAESMSPDRACAILRYAMDDVLRSGLRAGQPVPLPDPSKRADVVLNRPKGHPSMSGVMGQAGVVQSSDEALASLIEELKEIMGAPVFIDTPLQSVARRFWVALNDTQKSQQKNEERLEQNLGKLKGDYLLARAVCLWQCMCACASRHCELGCFAHYVLRFFVSTGMGRAVDPDQGKGGAIQGKVRKDKGDV